MRHIGIVAIGRNEGERLRRCLASVAGTGHAVVYVDSGSTDDSLAVARSCEIDIVELDGSLPFTAARARNAGFEYLVDHYTDIEFVQFVDGDCEIMGSWLERAAQELDSHPDVVVVAGRLRERMPQTSIYKRLCDMEWNADVGEADHCGGIFMIRVAAFRSVGGFDPAIAGGEEPELCLRLRGCGHRIVRLGEQMGVHDAGMARFGQWWRRAVRCGRACAEGAMAHGREPERHDVREVCSALLWAVAVPSLAVAGFAGAVAGYPTMLAWPLAALCGYTLLGYRIYRWRQTFDDSPRDSLLYATFCILAKAPQCCGIALYLWRRLRRGPSSLIEYKTQARNCSQGGANDDQRKADRSQSPQCSQVDRPPNA